MDLHGKVIVIAAEGLGQKMAETVAGSGRPITAAKAAVAAMTVTWAKELARYKIRVAGIAPGFGNKVNPARQSAIDWRVSPGSAGHDHHLRLRFGCPGHRVCRARNHARDG